MPKNPDESTLVLRIKGEIEPRMPQGANTKLSDAAIAKIERWVKEGATLDSGNDPKKPIASYAASAEQVRQAEVAKLPVGERDKKTEEVGLQRFKQANASLKPEVVPSDHFMMFSNSSQGPGHEHAQAARKPVWAPQADSRLRSHRLA